MMNARQAMRRAIQAAALILGGSFVSANCNPPPACNSPTCPSGQFLLAGKCVTPLPPGSSCNRLTSVCAYVNGAPYACIDGTCKPGTGVGAPCSSQTCAYARNAEEPAYCTCDGLCGRYSHLFESCDSNAASPKCTPCLPGLQCSGGRCIQPCSSDLDCPCDADGNPAYTCRTVEGSASPTARCATCRSLGATCDTETMPCCDSGESCSPASHRCCRNEGSACSTNADCCSSNDVCKNGTCQACGKAGNGCTTSGDCCTGLTCAGGQCAVPCTPDVDCTIPDLQGACAIGTTVCSPDGPVCQQVHSPQPEQCDGKDDDCNGKIDDIAPTPCTNGTVVDATCQSGFTAPGTMQCVKGKAACVATPCDTNNASATNCYCTTCGAGGGGTGGPCGVCHNDPCTPGTTLCTPNQWCHTTNTGDECLPQTGCPPTPACWTPKDLKVVGCYGATG